MGDLIQPDPEESRNLSHLFPDILSKEDGLLEVAPTKGDSLVDVAEIGSFGGDHFPKDFNGGLRGFGAGFRGEHARSVYPIAMQLTLQRLNGSTLTLGALRSSLVCTAMSSAASPHLVLVGDRSGSMWGSMEDLQQTILQALSIQDFFDAEGAVSLISYSGSGDVIIHFEHVPVAEIMKAGSKYQGEIKKLRATGLTCISQALEAAILLVRPGEVTGIVLHTDGQANDPGPGIEQRKLLDLAGKLPEGAFLNTVAYGPWSDFALLDQMATKGSGKALMARSAKEVYSAFEAASKTLSGTMAPSVVLERGSDAFALVAICSKSGKILVTKDEKLSIRGLQADEEIISYRLTRNGSGQGSEVPAKDALAIARGLLGLGQINMAKQILLGSGIAEVQKHIRAVDRTKLGEMAVHLEELALGTEPVPMTRVASKTEPLPASVMDILGILGQHLGGFRVHMPSLLSGYTRKSVRKVSGSRDKATGDLILPAVTTVPDRSDWAEPDDFTMNTDSANVSIRFKTPTTLHRTAKDEKGKIQVDAKGHTIPAEQIDEIAGIPLRGKLFEFRQYVLVGDGQVSVGKLVVRIHDASLWKALATKGAVTGKFDPQREVEIDLASRPLLDLTRVDQIDIPKDLAERLFALRTVRLMLASMIRGTTVSATYSEEQVAALKEHGLSASLGINIPTAVPWKDRKDAIANGTLDFYTKNRVVLGTTKILAPGDLFGGNDFFDRHFGIEGSGLWTLKKAVAKVPMGRKKPNPADDVQLPLYEAFLGTKEAAPLEALLKSVGVDPEDIEEFLKFRTLASDKVSSEDFATWRKEQAPALHTKILKAVSSFEDRLIEDNLRALVYYIGATGMLPDSLELEGYDADSLAEKLKIKVSGKGVADGTFYILPDGKQVLSVFPSSEEFTP